MTSSVCLLTGRNMRLHEGYYIKKIETAQRCEFGLYSKNIGRSHHIFYINLGTRVNVD